MGIATITPGELAQKDRIELTSLIPENSLMVAVPRPITGTIGSRIRLVLGKTGDEWLLLQNHDHGNREWQEKSWDSMPFAVAKQLNNCMEKGRDTKA